VYAFDCYPATWPIDAAAWLTPNGILQAWIALRGSSIVGHVVAGAVDDREDPHLAISSHRRPSEMAEVKRLFVAPAARGTGIVELLLDTSTSYARARALHPVLEVAADHAAAIRCYERTGWRRTGSHNATWQRASGARPLLHQYEFSS
jgi:ribosomal-protein-alanine N-acetyltransferase